MFKNKGKRENSKWNLTVLVLTLAIAISFWCSEAISGFAMGTAKVVASSGMIREKADKTSEVVASVEKGNSLDVISQTTDADGYTWYKVYVNKDKTGYVRADLVTVEGSIASEENTTEKKASEEEKKQESNEQAQESSGNKTVVGSNNSTKTEKATEKTTTNNETTEAEVSVSETDVSSVKAIDTVRVRKGAGTNFDVVEVVEKGTLATVSGIAADAQGKDWYQVSFNKGNKTVNGFIREDLVEVVERIEPVVEEIVEEEAVLEEEPMVETEDYYLQYMPNESGEMDWFLFDNIQGTKQSLSQLLQAVEQVNSEEENQDGQGATMRMIIIAMAAVLVILIIVITILIFKLRDAEYEYEDDDEYDDSDDDEDETDDDSEEDKNEDDDDDVETEEKKTKASRIGFFKKKEVEEENVEIEEEKLEEILPQAPEKEKNKSWQSKDFLELDDDMEFEFLDL